MDRDPVGEKECGGGGADIASGSGVPAKALESLERVRAALNHDLRTPLTVIISYAQTLAQGKAGELSETQREMLDVVVREGYRMDGLIRELVALLREAMERL